MSKILRISLNLFISFLVISNIFIIFPEKVMAALPDCKTLGMQVEPDKGIYKDDDQINFTVSLLPNSDAYKTVIPSDKFVIVTSLGFRRIGTSSTFFNFDRDNNQLTANTNVDLTAPATTTWPIGQYEVRIQKSGSDYCIAQSNIIIVPSKLYDVKCNFSLPVNIKFGEGYKANLQITPIQGVTYEPLLYLGNRPDRDFALSNEETLAGKVAPSLLKQNFLWNFVPGSYVLQPVFNLFKNDGYGDARTHATTWTTFDASRQTLEIKKDLPIRIDGYTLVINAKLQGEWFGGILPGVRLPGNEFGTVCWVNRFKVTTDPTSELFNTGGVQQPQPSAPQTAGIPTKAGGDPCGNDVNPGIKTAIGCIHTNPAVFVKDIMTFAIGIGGGLAFLMMLLGAFQMLTSAGNPDTLKAGQDRLTSAVIGLLFVIFAVLLMQIIGANILGLPDFK